MNASPQIVVDALFAGMAERNAWIDARVAEKVAEAEGCDARLALAFSGACLLLRGKCERQMIEAYRSVDDAELGRLFRSMVVSKLAHDVEFRVEEEAFERFGEA